MAECFDFQYSAASLNIWFQYFQAQINFPVTWKTQSDPNPASNVWS